MKRYYVQKDDGRYCKKTSYGADFVSDFKDATLYQNKNEADDLAYFSKKLKVIEIDI